MELFEYEAKAILASNGISVPKGAGVKSLAEAIDAFKGIGKEVVIKPMGIKGRGKIGAVAFAKSEDEVRDAVNRLLGKTIKEETIKELIVEERLKIDRELYAAITVDFSTAAPVLILSTEGGVDIESVARSNPELINRSHMSITKWFDPDAMREPLSKVGIKDPEPVLGVLQNLYKIFKSYDAETVEVNPLAESDGKFFALDALMTINDDSLPRHKELEQMLNGRKYRSDMEREMGDLGWSYADLDGDIGIICSGAGLTMATLDMISANGGKAGNFLDLAQVDGDGIYKALNILSKKSNRSILINLVAGLNRCDSMAEGVKRFVSERGSNVPITVRMVGNLQAEGEKVLDSVGLKNISALEEAVSAAAHGGRPTGQSA